MPGIAFEWDRRKEAANRRKHAVGFEEASTVFDDPLSITIPDPDCTIAEERFGSGYGSSVPEPQPITKDAAMKKTPSKRPAAGMRPEYDFSCGVRGKYVERYRRGTNVLLLDPELLEAFPNSKSVNDALRALLAIATRAETRKPV